MGNCCDCMEPEETNYGTISVTNYGAVASTSTNQPFSVRPHRNPSLERNTRISKASGTLIGVERIDKRVKDHIDLYNYIVDTHLSLHSSRDQLLHTYPSETFLTPPTMKDIFTKIKDQFGNTTIFLKRRHQFRMEIIYDEVSSREGIISATVVSMVASFNQINRSCFELITKIPPLQDVISMSISENDQYQRDITVFPWEQEIKKIEALKSHLGNINELTKIPPQCREMRDDAKKIFEELLQATSILFSED